MRRFDSNGSRDDRRVDARNKVRKVGRVVVEETGKIYSCIILDISSTGALLLVHDKVPDRFGLFYSAKRTLCDVAVVRRHNDTLGVRFESEPVVLQSGDKRLAFLRA